MLSGDSHDCNSCGKKFSLFRAVYTGEFFWKATVPVWRWSCAIITCWSTICSEDQKSLLQEKIPCVWSFRIRLVSRQKSEILVEYFHKVFCERCGMDLKVELDFVEVKESKYREKCCTSDQTGSGKCPEACQTQRGSGK